MLYFSFRDPKTPWYSKLGALGAIFYLLSPIDIIPDFIPVVGYLDDLVIVPVLLSVASTLLPAEVKLRAEKRAAASAKKLNWTLMLFALIVIALLIYILSCRTGRGT